ncbi:hypothetical protein DRQ07_03230 [candidate division KSB1 bacterium]|nr:MAG: hypothetical protein DRQ07_03230 [candidate division KSB1 bacterium]
MRSKIKVLLAESEAIIAEDVSTYLKEWGFDILGRAINKDQLLKFVKNYRPEIVVLDYFLNGEEDTRRVIEKIHSKFGTPVVILGDYPDKFSVKKGRNDLSWVSKPFHEKELKKAVKKMAAKKSANRAA